MDENMLTNNDILIKWLPFFIKLFDKWNCPDDLRQMVYLDFLQYDNKKLNELNDSGQLRYWIVRFVKNYWFSKTSRYYAQYEKYYEHFEQLPED